MSFFVNDTVKDNSTRYLPRSDLLFTDIIA